MPLAIRKEDEETHFTGHGFLDNYSDRLIKRDTKYVWVSDRSTVTFSPSGPNEFRSSGNRYILVDNGVATTPRFQISTAAQGDVRKRWTFNTFTYQPGAVSPAPEYYVLDSFRVGISSTGQDGYGWTVIRNMNGTIDRVTDTLNRQLVFTHTVTVYGTIQRLTRITAVTFKPSPTVTGVVVAQLRYHGDGALERITFADGRYARFRYDTSNTTWCPRCQHLLSEVIRPRNVATPPGLGVPVTANELVTEGHEYSYFTASDGVSSFRARKSFGPGRAWFYKWVAGAVTQLDLNQPQMLAGVPIACSPSCSTGFGCYPTADGGDNKCYVERSITTDPVNANTTGVSGVLGASYLYNGAQAPTRDADSAGRKTTYAYSVNGEISCIVHNDDDDSALSGGSCVGPAGSVAVSIEYLGACSGVAGSVASVVTRTAGALGLGDRVDTECIDSHGQIIATKRAGSTRDIAGSPVAVEYVASRTLDTLGREIQADGPLGNATAKDVVDTSFYATFDSNWPYNLGRVHQVTRHVGTSTSSVPLTTTYSEYDFAGVPHLIVDANGRGVRYEASTDRLTWTVKRLNLTGGVVATSVVTLNANGTVRSSLDADLVCMTYEYNLAGAVTRLRRSNTQCGVVPININDGEVEIRTYVNDDPSRLQSIERRNNGTIEYTYSGFTYDVNRRLVASTTLDSASPFTYAFTDVLPSGVTAPGGPGIGTWRTETTVDALARPLSVLRYLDGSNKQTSTLGYSSSANNRPTQLSRGYNGSATSVTTFVYDDFGRLVQATVPENGSPASPTPTRFEYDAADRLIKQRVGASTPAVRTSALSYDSLGRTTFVDHDTEHPVDCATAPAGTPIQDEEYVYDGCSVGDVPAGMSCSDSRGALVISRAIVECASGGQTLKRGRWYQFDSAGRVSNVGYANVLGGVIGPSLITTHTYTAASRKLTWTSVSASSGTRYVLDGSGRPITITTTGMAPIAHNLTYRALGSLTGFGTPVSQPVGAYARTLTMSAGYRNDDSLNNVQWTLVPNDSSVPTIQLMAQTFGYSPAGLVMMRTDTADIEASRFYRYDSLLRMTCEARGTTTHPTSSDCVTSSARLAALFTYGDGQTASTPPDVRMTSFIKNAGAVKARYTSPSIESSVYSNGSGQVQQVARNGSNLIIAYDGLGRRISEYDSRDATKSLRSYSYLPNGQLRSVTGKDATGTAYTFQVRYDAEGRPNTIAGTRLYELFWDDEDRLIGASIDSGAVLWNYHYLGSSLVAASRHIGSAVKRFWAISDERDLIHRLVDEQGATFWQARWDASGWRAIVGTPQPEMWVPFGLPGQIVLDGTAAFVGTGGVSTRAELAINGVRVADPTLGAFLRPDPSDQHGRVAPEQYSYGRNNPITLTDPSGSESVGRPMAPIPSGWEIGFDSSCTMRDRWELLNARNQALQDIEKCREVHCGVPGGEAFRRQWRFAVQTGLYYCVKVGQPVAVPQDGYTNRSGGKGEFEVWGPGELDSNGNAHVAGALVNGDGGDFAKTFFSRRRHRAGLGGRITIVGQVPSTCWAQQVAHEALHGVLRTLHRGVVYGVHGDDYQHMIKSGYIEYAASDMWPSNYTFNDHHTYNWKDPTSVTFNSMVGCVKCQGPVRSLGRIGVVE